MSKKALYHFTTLVILFLGCHQDPEYLLDFDRIQSTPGNVTVSINDAFSLAIMVTLDGSTDIERLSVYRLSKDSSDFNDSEFQKVMDVTPSDSTVSIIIDTGAIYGQYNFYTLTGHYGEVESFFSDTVSLQFQLEAPQGSVGLVDNGIKQTIQLEYDFMTGLEIRRASNLDTLIKYVPYEGQDTFHLVDTLQYDNNSPLDSFAAVLHPYLDIQPNVNYSYEIRSFQDRNDDRIFSPILKIDSVVYVVNDPILTVSALTDTSFRIYCKNVSSSEYDSLFIFTLENSLWVPTSAYALEEQVVHNNSYLIDIPSIIQRSHKVVVKNTSYHSLPKSLVGMLLPISGFALIESGEFTWGCIEGDQQCNENEYPSMETFVDYFYMGVFEVTKQQYSSPGSWDQGFESEPVDSISYQDAQDFCGVMNAIYPDFTFYLPTEVEWEYAAKSNYWAQVNTIFPWGNQIDVYNANYGYQNEGPISVGSYDFPSFQGQYDMAGNVMEWVDNCYEEQLSQSNEQENCWKVVKGGAYWSDGADLRISRRYHLPPDQGFDGVGLRLAMKPNNQ